jgi:hypothetical protein
MIVFKRGEFQADFNLEVVGREPPGKSSLLFD